MSYAVRTPLLEETGHFKKLCTTATYTTQRDVMRRYSTPETRLHCAVDNLASTGIHHVVYDVASTSTL
jgi:hypothetical protein